MRTTASQLPITVPASTLREYKRVAAVDIHLTTTADGMQTLAAQFSASDSAGSLLAGHGFNVDIPDIADAENSVPRLTQALDTLTDILGRYYRLQFVEAELLRTSKADPKYALLKLNRDAAESDVRQPVTRRLNR